MSESKFTPGPWRAEPPNDYTPNIWIAADDDAGGICKFEPCDYGDGPGPVLTPIDYANARLIAAAPELFEALRELVAIRTIKDKLEEPNNGEWPDMAALRERTDAAWASARAALLKASPEQSE